jgi:hypothetical protein
VKPEPQGGARVEVRPLGEADVAELIACVRRCYGETYGESGFYDEDWLIAQMRSRRLLSVGACDEERVVGHIGTTVTRPDDAVGDTVAAMVEPGYRGRGLVHEMGRLLFAMFQERGIVATRHLATGTHLRTQRPLAESSAVPTGVLLGHVRAGTAFRGIEHRFDHHRIGVVAYFQRYGDLEDFDIHLPVHYASVLTKLYERAGLRRHERPPITVTTTSRHDEPTTDITVQDNHLANVSTVHITATLDARISTAELADALEHREEVTYVDVPLAHPDCPAAVEWLRGRGFIFGALLPGTVDSERVRMQHVLADQVKPDAIECATAEGTTLRDSIASELANPGQAGRGL